MRNVSKLWLTLIKEDTCACLFFRTFRVWCYCHIHVFIKSTDPNTSPHITLFRFSLWILFLALEALYQFSHDSRLQTELGTIQSLAVIHHSERRRWQSQFAKLHKYQAVNANRVKDVPVGAPRLMPAFGQTNRWRRRDVNVTPLSEKKKSNICSAALSVTTTWRKESLLVRKRKWREKKRWQTHQTEQLDTEKPNSTVIIKDKQQIYRDTNSATAQMKYM